MNKLVIDPYDCVPSGWTKEELLNLHSELNGEYSIDSPAIFGNWYTDPNEMWRSDNKSKWFEYRETLRKVGDGVKLHDKACIEISIRYIELNYFGSYSGFIRARLARLLKNKVLDKKQKQRLNRHFTNLKNAQLFFREFKEIKKLILNINEDHN